MEDRSKWELAITSVVIYEYNGNPQALEKAKEGFRQLVTPEMPLEAMQDLCYEIAAYADKFCAGTGVQHIQSAVIATISSAWDGINGWEV